MDAISDISRGSQILSTLPLRPPLPDPLDLDELFGFNKAFKKRGLVEEVIEFKYFDKNTIFINNVDSYVGKYIVKVLSHKQTEEVAQERPEIDNSIILDQIKTTEDNTKGNEELIDSEPKSKGKSVKSPKKSKDDKKSKPSKRKSPVTHETLSEPLLENVEDLRSSFFGEEQSFYDTSKLTVPDYYEMLELEPGPDREEYLKEKLLTYSQQFQSTTYPMEEPVETLKICTVEKSGDFKIIGTLKNNEHPETYIQEGVKEIIQISQENTDFLEKLVSCGVIIYIVNEDEDQVIEASGVLNALLKCTEEIKGNVQSHVFRGPLVILLSSFMTWSLTKPLNPKKPELPFTERDYRKRIPHPNYKMHYALEEQLISMKLHNEIEVIILTCGIPYGHEENVLSYFFQTAYHCLDLPVYSPGTSWVPVVHVENVGLIIREVIKKRHAINLPFLFTKDPISYTMKEIIKGVSNYFGSGCCRIMPAPYSFLIDTISQDIYDQITAQINLVSCYPLFNEEDIYWKYGTGFVENINYITKEFMNAQNLKPIRMVLYGFSNVGMEDVALKLSEYYQIPYLNLDIILQEYFCNMQEKVSKLEDIEFGDITQNTSSLHATNNKVDFELTQYWEECQENDDFENSLLFFKNLNLKHSGDIQMLSEAQKMSILKECLKKRVHFNYGYILFELPQSVTQAQLLFEENGEIIIESDSSNKHSNLPDYLIYLNKLQDQTYEQEFIDETNKSEEENNFNYGHESNEQSSVTLKEKLQSFVEQKDTLAAVGDPENIIGEIEESRKSLNVEELPIHFFQKNNEKCKLVKVDIHNFNDTEDVFNKILKAIKGNNTTDEYELPEFCNVYNNSSFPKLIDNQRMMSYKEREEMNNSVDKVSKTDIQKKAEFEQLKEKEEILLGIKSCPLIKYLICFVFPTLTDAILEVTAQRPQDPLDVLAEYIFKNNPDGRMMDPSE